MSTVVAIAAALLALAFLIADWARARARLARWPVLEARGDRGSADVVFLIAPGVTLDASVREAAAAHLRAHDLEAVDLVPADLGVGALLELASLADPAALARDPFARTAGAGHAIAVTSALLDRCRLAVPANAPALAAACEELRRYAAGRTGTAIAPGLAAVRERSQARGAMLRARAGTATGPRLYLEGLRWAAIGVALAAAPPIGLIVVAIATVAPSIVTAGLAVRPRDRWVSPIARVPADVLAWIRACVQPDPRAAAIAAARPRYRQMIAAGTAGFFDERRRHCPLCASERIAHHLTATDLVQRKPGTFALNRCAACGLIFQNPALSAEGLSYYYADFYDGLGADVMDEVFASTHALYASRIDAIVSEGAPPRRWLDLGCGYGHFSLAARRKLPGTRFEGLDRSASVEVAQRRGWIDRGWNITTAELAATPERFDVVSLFHYLEHIQDPAAEIRMAAQLLAPGGRLAIEIPNPRCRLGWWLGRWWFPWFQPQHQLFLDEAAVRRLLDAAGLQPVAVSYLMTAGDVLLAALLAVRRAGSPGDVPWAPRPATARVVADLALWVAALPLFVLAIAADAAYAALPSSPANSNALRVIAVARER